AKYMMKDLADWARSYGLEILFPPSVFPVNSVKSLRGALVALEHGKFREYSDEVFRRYWSDDRDISQDDVLAAIARDVGLDAKEYFEKIASPPYKDRIRANTEECVARGGFGSPTMFVGDSMFFGNDRIVLVEEELKRL
ncbi:MAG: 2-hydroxychromene-2-carboxylate isomerase, partial [Candidatus Binatia bacterium]